MCVVVVLVVAACHSQPHAPETMPDAAADASAPISCAASGATIFAVDDYGADPTGAADSTQAFTMSLGAATATGSASTVAIGSGTYTVNCTTPVGPTASFCFAI